jgi:hypothetical protein
MPPNIIDAPTLTSARPPRSLPTNIRQKLIKRDVIPASFIRKPMKMNRGRAMRV